MMLAEAREATEPQRQFSTLPCLIDGIAPSSAMGGVLGLVPRRQKFHGPDL
jgi:hypothetical protein